MNAGRGLATASIILALAACSPEQAPDRAAAERLVQSIDDAVEERALARFRGLFEGNETYLGDGFARHLALFQSPQQLSLDSSVIDFDLFGTTAVATVRTEVRNEDGERGHCDSYLVLSNDHQQPRVLLAAPVNLEARAAVSSALAGVFSCPPCNYAIGAEKLDQWLVVPAPAATAGCMESVSFHRPGTPLVLTLSVVHLAMGTMLSDVLRKVVEDPTAELTPWEPSAGLAGYSTKMASAERESTLYLSASTSAEHAILATSAPLGYLQTVAGTPAAVAAHRRDIDTWLHSLRRISARSSAEVSSSATAAHGGGRLTKDNRYLNPSHGLHCRGPQHWLGATHPGPGLFRVQFCSPEGGASVRLTGYPRPEGSAETVTQHIERAVKARVAELGYGHPPRLHWEQGRRRPSSRACWSRSRPRVRWSAVSAPPSSTPTSGSWPTARVPAMRLGLSSQRCWRRSNGADKQQTVQKTPRPRGTPAARTGRLTLSSAPFSSAGTWNALSSSSSPMPSSADSSARLSVASKARVSRSPASS